MDLSKSAIDIESKEFETSVYPRHHGLLLPTFQADLTMAVVPPGIDESLPTISLAKCQHPNLYSYRCPQEPF